MYYIDTSVLVAYYCPEPFADKAEEFLAKIDKPNISALTEVELFSALSRKLRNKPDKLPRNFFPTWRENISIICR
jgi:predicted nucleic acid-binding protein